LHEQEQFYATAGWALGLSTFGQIKTANAADRQARLEADRQLDLVRAQVARAAEESATQSKLIPMARQQAAAAEEALRLAQANLRAGTMLTLDVLQAEDAVDEARLRHATAVARYNQAQVNLLAAVGLIDPTSLFPPNVPASPPAGPATAPATGADR
jgi:outer membrane protein TolC